MAANLTSWKKGQSGNPGGRPKKKLVDRALEDLLLENDSGRAKELAEKVMQLALSGNMDAIKFVAERTEGRAVQKMELSGDLNLNEMSDEEIRQRLEELRGTDDERRNA